MRLTTLLTVVVSMVLLVAVVSAQTIRDPRTFKRLERSQELVEEERYEEAATLLTRILEGRLNDEEEAIVLQNRGYAYLYMEDYDRALPDLERVLELDQLPKEIDHNIRLLCAQLNMADESYERALMHLRVYLDDAEPEQLTKDTYMLGAQAAAELERYSEAIIFAYDAIALSAEPDKRLYEFVLGIYYRESNMAKVRETLAQMVRLFPDEKRFWSNLSSAYLQAQMDEKSLATLALAKENGFALSEQEMLTLARLYLFVEIPYRAGLIYQEGLDIGVVTPSERVYVELAQAWVMAREFDRALTALRQAASFTPKADYDIRVADILLEKEEFAQAVDVLEVAVYKEGNEELGRTWYLLGQAYHGLERHRDAYEAFREAVLHEGTYAGAAEDWSNYLLQECVVELRDELSATPTANTAQG